MQPSNALKFEISSRFTATKQAAAPKSLKRTTTRLTYAPEKCYSLESVAAQLEFSVDRYK
jgi:hypothetical protein